MSLNKVMLIGNVGRDPEVRYMDGAAANGQERKVATFSLATSERYRSRSGEMVENTEWHNIVVWSPMADTVERYVKKGTQLYVEGRIRTRQWTDQSGAKRYSTEIIADSFQLLGRRDDNPATSAGSTQPSYSGRQQGGYSGQQGSYGSQGGYASQPAPAYQPPVNAPSPAPAPAAPAAASAPAPVQQDPSQMDDLPF